MGSEGRSLAQRSKRWLWGEIIALKQKLEDSDAALTSVIVAGRKHATLEAVSNSLRLPALMPSQYGEDVLAYEFFGRKREGFFVEIGAFDGVALSNTYFLEALGWSGILVEPNPEHYDAIISRRPFSKVVHAACGRGADQVRFSVAKGNGGVSVLSYMGENRAQAARIAREGGIIEETLVPCLSLDEIMRGEDRQIDLLSIDVEGAEIQVLEGCNLKKLRPRAIIAEDNAGGGDTRVAEYLASLGYRRDFIWMHNHFYVECNDSRCFRW